MKKKEGGREEQRKEGWKQRCDSPVTPENSS